MPPELLFGTIVVVGGGFAVAAFFLFPVTLLVLGVAVAALGAFLSRRTSAASRTTRAVVLASGAALLVAGAAGMVRGALAERTEADERAAARAAAAAEQLQQQQRQMRVEEEARVERERVVREVPQTILAWRTAVEAAKTRVLEAGLALPTLAVFSDPPSGQCPNDIRECQEARSEFAEELDAVQVPNGWLTAVDELLAARNEIEANTVIDSVTYARWTVLVARTEVPDACPSRVCTTQRQRDVAALASAIRRRSNDVYLEATSTERVKLMYADLRDSGRPVVLRSGTLQSDTYYNCSFRSQSTWRSFRYRSSFGDVFGISVYCQRGVDWCEDVYRRASSGMSVSQVILRYPRRNSICEEDQMYLTNAR